MTNEIKGTCEWCGFAYKGSPNGDKDGFSYVTCPDCGLQSQNFDQSYVIDELDKAEGHDFDYQDSEIEIIN